MAVPWGEGSKTRLSFANKGSGIRFGGDGKRDGIKNRAYGNVIRDNSQYGIQMTRNPQGFKQVNDRLGHRAGDGVLRAVASRLLTAIRPGDTVARFGGDEFTILGTELDHPGEAEEIARRLTDALAEPFPVGTESVALGASIGIALAPGLAEHPEEVIARADDAMYRAKQAGRGWEFAVADASA